MSSLITLKAVGLNQQTNQLEAEEGSLNEAKNVIIRRDNVVESRRGFSLYGDALPSSTDRVKQLLLYKDRILRHYGTTLQFDNGSGGFSSFSGSFSEIDSGLRIKGIESNSNFYFTSSEGIKKISAKTASDLSTSSGFITNAGAAKALDLTGTVKYTYADQTSFFTQDSAVAYRVLWAYTDNNNNLVRGSPSQRIEVYNSLLSLLIPDYMTLLGALDDLGRSGSVISDSNYVNTLKLDLSSSADNLRTNLLSLTAKIDNDILYADNDGAPTGAPLELDTASISSGIATITFSSGTATDYFSNGSKIFLAGFSPATGTLDGAQTVASVTATQITFNTTATGAVAISGSATIVSNEYRNLTQPSVVSTPATNAQLVELQTYISNIISRLALEPIAVISSTLQTNIVGNLDVTKTSTVNLEITIPEDVDSRYFFQIYRSLTFIAEDTAVLSTDVFPNDELQLVYEAYPTSSELSSGSIFVEDIVPDAFRGANLYTNAATGEGILQANDIPPLAKDINVFKNSVFYANTKTRHRKSLALIGVQNMITDFNNGITPTITISTETTSNTYTFVLGESEQFDIVCSNGASLNSSGTADYFDVNSGADERLYRFYYKIGTAVAPSAGGRTLVEIIADAGDTSTQIAEKTRDAFNRLPIDFIATNVTNTVSVTCNTVGLTTDPVDGTTGFTITVTNQGDGEDIPNKKILLSDDVSPARAVQDTAFSLSRVINNNNTSEVVYSYYLSGAQEVPGKLLFESRTLNGDTFYINTNNSNTGQSFNPTFEPDVVISSITTGSPTANLITTSTAHGLTNLDFVFISGSDCTPSIDGYHQITLVSSTTFRINETITVGGTKGGLVKLSNSEKSSNEESKNRVYYSKFQEPEAVPILNFFDVGAKDKAILRIFPLRDSLFVFKEDGLYRISGEAIPFNLALFDNSCILVAPDSVSSVENIIFGWTRLGIASVTESGIRNMSRPIDITLLPLASVSYSNFSTATWGIGYESDNSYTAYTVSSTSDTVAMQGFRYSTLTNSWTRIDKSYTCGIIGQTDDKMYVGCGDINYIEKERKSFTREDYADRDYDLIIGTYLASEPSISVSNVDNINDFDVVVQTQTVNIYDYNMLLKKLDNDPGVNDTNYFSLLQASNGDNMRLKLLALTAKLDTDTGITDSDYTASIDDQSGSITAIAAGSSPISITSASHGLITGRIVTISGSNSTPSINGQYSVTVVDANTFTVNTGFSVTTAGTSGSFLTDNTDFQDLKTCYNKVINKLNLDSGVGFTNYTPITIDTIQEALIERVDIVTKKLYINQDLPFILGDMKVYNSIDCELVYSPTTAQNPVMLKHFREAQVMFENLAFTRGIISFATDLLPEFQEVEFNADGPGTFGFSNFGEGFFGGASHAAPIRTYIPRESQRCRYMVVKFNHKVAREKWSLFAVSLTGNFQVSERAYR